ncbi:MAG: glycosyltransferase family 2 protein [Alphaproteobacteria bacterium]|nr:glycosyltransferase family 2 protein [Alphaproteobacteria bacterium]MBU2092540.1 glycosyltransferase family 2 protein [Alphaproteobacteria bacterium]MBU2151348.1 glycosyltransferase family 2 protein [Alphaproteobacteria bacterium]MBU2309651.1 glycosyltransferase family 2 protein [Alphaproteobacteria bacterium]MBU2365864.1 glycosyltransferase family 2 protein [Alphaproteobacteria bacterium]
MVRLSALVCVQNQDAQLSECLRKLSFCDEIVVVADRCTDRSQEVARRQGAIVIDGIFPLESQRKAAGVEACSGDWILEIDPDELVDAALAWEIRAVLQMRPAGDWYDLPIDNYVGETRVRDGWAGALSARAGARLYKRGLKAWEPRRVNAPAVMAGKPGGALTGAIRRSLGRDVGGLMERLNRLTALSAEDMADAGRATSLAAGLFTGAGTFLRGYVGRGGWREGRLGLLTAMLSAMFPVLTQLRAGDVMAARNLASTEAAQVSRLPDVVGLAAR